jgi:hypothetical protein
MKFSKEDEKDLTAKMTLENPTFTTEFTYTKIAFWELSENSFF